MYSRTHGHGIRISYAQNDVYIYKDAERSYTQMPQLQQQLEFLMKASHQEQHFAPCYSSQHDKLE
jgi:hypothetical protein